MVTTEQSQEITTKYSVIVDNPATVNPPTVVRGESTCTNTSTEELTKAAAINREGPKSLMQAYEDMDAEGIDSRVYEGTASTSSSNSTHSEEPIVDQPLQSILKNIDRTKQQDNVSPAMVNIID